MKGLPLHSWHGQTGQSAASARLTVFRIDDVLIDDVTEQGHWNAAALDQSIVKRA
jgi:hypothetical protein